ncbi:carboxypeptidase-like regulatory domain-containing protein [Mucilaginibacter sp. KACC 22063]|uniref:carboxypeptidase-like regulatory domain-containing protein n=1 Tax=Mucilaginibacter sp. KACC 22063 TaxID=3025666 RepID=UPI00236554E1|nr:TonB-dependent receptor plug domain-containing protein [Mucilaginibacter sp. KACC 22063]WDF55546.1 TonB-dependent receptor plug domain-containing protein [Mucilaginibacter sp. KACC 22063]
MKKLKLPLLLVSAMICVVLMAFIKADDDTIKKAAAQLDKWLDNNPQEKVYLQTDKPYYSIGDDIWFKAYVTVGPRHQLSAMSGTLNVDLIAPNDSVARSIKLPLTNGVAAGDFALSDTLQEGNYRIRAYTQWMRNYDLDYFFNKTIWIGNGVTNKVFTQTSYAYSSQNNQPLVTATIIYTDANGAPYANKEVSYRVQLNARNAAKGHGTTDSKGMLKIAFVNNMPNVQKTGRITTDIRLDGKTVTKILPITAASDKIDVQFFPESGNMVNGLPGKVAFKAVGADGLGKTVTGKIVDNNGNQISDISTQHLGMGLFMLTPDAGKTYKAQVKFEDGSEGIYNLPKALDSGYALTITQHENDIFVRISASKDLTGTTQGSVSLVAQSAGAMCYASKTRLENQVSSSKIPKSKFPNGIVQFTLFDAAGNPVNERVIFVNNPDNLKLDVSAPKQTFATREKVNLQITANDPQDKPALSLLSASVIDETKVPSNEDDETTILSTILLSSDIKGYIEKPNYYFAHNDEKTRSDLDLLMLTQGYRRFEWKNILADTYTPIVFKPEQSLTVSGTVHTSNKKPVVKGKVTLFTTAGGTFIIDTLTDDQGHFSFPNLTFKDSIRFVIQARTEKGKKDVDIDLDNTAQQAFTANPNAPDVEVNVDNKILPYLKSNKEYYQEQIRSGTGNHNIVLKEVVIREKKQNKAPNSANLNGAGNADQIITADMFENMGCPTLSQCLQGRLVGVIFQNGRAYSTRSMSSSFRGPVPMGIVLDGMQVDADFLDNLNPHDISSIEVLKSGAYLAIYGSRAGGGLLVITTKRGGEVTYQKYAPGVVTYTPKGYYRARTFYSPQYDDPKVNTALADLRSTIYWNPNIVTDKDGKSTLTYFNAGTKGIYKVIVEGIDADGHIGRKVYRYTVE